MNGVTVKTCTLAPRNVQGVDQVTIGIVMPRQVVGFVVRQPQSKVSVKYRPCGRGAPVGIPTVSPGCVTDPASAVETPMHIDSTTAVATFTTLFRIFASDHGSRWARDEQHYGSTVAY